MLGVSTGEVILQLPTNTSIKNENQQIIIKEEKNDKSITIKTSQPTSVISSNTNDDNSDDDIADNTIVINAENDPFSNNNSLIISSSENNPSNALITMDNRTSLLSNTNASPKPSTITSQLLSHHVHQTDVLADDSSRHVPL